MYAIQLNRTYFLSVLSWQTYSAGITNKKLTNVEIQAASLKNKLGEEGNTEHWN